MDQRKLPVTFRSRMWVRSSRWSAPSRVSRARITSLRDRSQVVNSLVRGAKPTKPRAGERIAKSETAKCEYLGQGSISGSPGANRGAPSQRPANRLRLPSKPAATASGWLCGARVGGARDPSLECRRIAGTPTGENRARHRRADRRNRSHLAPAAPAIAAPRGGLPRRRTCGMASGCRDPDKSAGRAR